jgi:hypothetical protein
MSSMKMTTMNMNDAVLSLDDVRAENTLLRPHDLTSLHTRLEGAIRRRQLATALLAGAVALAAAGGIAHLASRDWTPAPPPPPVIEQPLMASATSEDVTPPVFHLDMTPDAPCTIVEAPKPRPIIVVQRPAVETEVVRSEGEDSERIVVEGSRLRSQLRIYDEGQRALHGGDPERALARATHLREKYPNGPLDIDAAILRVRALRALDRLDEARSALGEAESHALAPEKKTVLAELRALLTKAEAPRPSRVLESWPRDVDGALIEPSEGLAQALEDARGDGDDEDRQPTRVIEPVGP